MTRGIDFADQEVRGDASDDFLRAVTVPEQYLILALCGKPPTAAI
jgi:hypothetical protein